MAGSIAYRLTALALAAALGASLSACGGGGSAPLIEGGEAIEIETRAAQRTLSRPYDATFLAIQSGAPALGLRELGADMASGRMTFSIAGVDAARAIVCTDKDGGALPFLKDALAAGARLNGQALVRVLPEGQSATTVITAVDYILTLPAKDAEEPVIFTFPSGGAAMRLTGEGETKTPVRCAGTNDLEAALLATAG